jgi:hypothetical protein
MKNVSVENALRWMLAAWMLLATSITSSTFVHGHNGGNLAHQQHDGFDYALSYSSVRAAFHDGHDKEMSLSAADVHRHRCLPLLGAITYQPMSGEPSGSHEKSLRGWEMIVTVSAGQGARTLVKNLAVDHSGLASLAVFSIGCIRESKQHETLCASAAPASPLCDRARHERSGVQLA